MRYPVAARIVLSTICVGFLAASLSYIGVELFGISIESQLLDVVTTVVPMSVVYVLFWYWTDELWWFLPTKAVDQ